MSSLKQLQNEYEAAKKQLEQLSTEKERKEELLQSLQTGVSSKEGHETGYANELHIVRQNIANAHTASAQAKVRLESLQKQLRTDKPKIEKAREQHAGTISALDEMRQQFTYLKSKMSEAGIVPGKLEELKAKESKLSEEVRQLARKIDEAKRTVSNIDFNYSRPSNSFNPASVKGVVAQLFSLEEQKYEAATALEVCAGGRLYQVVVDSDQTASQLLQNGKLKRRVTIIPLNKISTFKITAEKRGAAQSLAPGKVHLALNLIGYDHEVEKAMEYVFGNTLICADADSAKRVAFDPNVRIKTVTLDGDVYDPMGTLSGGSTSSGSNGILVKLQKLNAMTNKHKSLTFELDDVKKNLHIENDLMTKCRALKKELDLKEHEIKLSEKKLESGPFATTLKAFEESTAKIEELQQQMTEANDTEQQGVKEIERIEKELAEFNNNKGGKLKELEVSVNFNIEFFF